MSMFQVRDAGKFSFAQARSTSATTTTVVAGPGDGNQIVVVAYRAIASGAGTVKLQDNAGVPVVLLAVSDAITGENNYGPFVLRCTASQQLDVVTTGTVNITHQVWYRVVPTGAAV